MRRSAIAWPGCRQADTPGTGSGQVLWIILASGVALSRTKTLGVLHLDIILQLTDNSPKPTKNPPPTQAGGTKHANPAAL
jgi:hypothetical protein